MVEKGHQEFYDSMGRSSKYIYPSTRRKEILLIPSSFFISRDLWELGIIKKRLRGGVSSAIEIDQVKRKKSGLVDRKETLKT